MQAIIWIIHPWLSLCFHCNRTEANLEPWRLLVLWRVHWGSSGTVNWDCGQFVIHWCIADTTWHTSWSFAPHLGNSTSHYLRLSCWWLRGKFQNLRAGSGVPHQQVTSGWGLGSISSYPFLRKASRTVGCFFIWYGLQSLCSARIRLSIVSNTSSQN